jgi:hypothetical protein
MTHSAERLGQTGEQQTGPVTTVTDLCGSQGSGRAGGASARSSSVEVLAWLHRDGIPRFAEVWI